MQHALITGAAGAIGAALARALRQRWPAARLLLVDRDAGPLQAIAAEVGGVAVVQDLAEIDALDGLVDRAQAAAPLDLLVNCAGVMWVRQLDSPTWDEAWKLLAIDLIAPLKLMHRVAPAMAEGSVIVNVASMAGRVPLRGCAWYGAAKAGLAMASEVARADLGDRGVRVITVYPGPVASALERGAREDYGRRGLSAWMPTGQPDELARQIVAAIVQNRPRVIYPAPYRSAWRLPWLAERLALRWGPRPVR